MKHNMRALLSTEFYILWIAFVAPGPLVTGVGKAYVQ